MNEWQTGGRADRRVRVQAVSMSMHTHSHSHTDSLTMDNNRLENRSYWKFISFQKRIEISTSVCACVWSVTFSVVCTKGKFHSNEYGFVYDCVCVCSACLLACVLRFKHMHKTSNLKVVLLAQLLKERQNESKKREKEREREAQQLTSPMKSPADDPVRRQFHLQHQQNTTTTTATATATVVAANGCRYTHILPDHIHFAHAFDDNNNNRTMYMEQLIFHPCHRCHRARRIHTHR